MVHMTSCVATKKIDVFKHVVCQCGQRLGARLACPCRSCHRSCIARDTSPGHHWNGLWICSWAACSMGRIPWHLKEPIWYTSTHLGFWDSSWWTFQHTHAIPTVEHLKSFLFRFVFCILHSSSFIDSFKWVLNFHEGLCNSCVGCSPCTSPWWA